MLLAAAGWQLTPVKRSLLRRHRTAVSGPRARSLDQVTDAESRVLPPPDDGHQGIPGINGAGALPDGLCAGARCVGACWCLMLVMVAAPAGQVLWLAGLTALVTAERAFRDRVTPSASAAALGVAAVATLAVAGLLQ